ncbi:phage terminase small subunit P27 family [Pectinatus haikarae]|uniref:P27 family predicted phage terminase small subunit n=1 Tax=Pectinatus haikarae TaxID=349096 RepID=A0ABT9Y8C3_9FIRM|nr:phage terminase small subunit P27 family [Pectinatus haikarae]MDQ0204078.1 P27 family predicted phage terminase small subunit [Pectinatus haikarae]
MPGRPRKVVDISTGKIGKNKRSARRQQEKKIKLPRDALSPPAWLDEDAAAEFTRVVAEAGQIDLLDNLDLAILAIYANAWSRYMKLVQHIHDYGDTGYRKNGYGEYETVSPYLSAQERYVKQIMQCSTKLGLATTDRLKLIVPVKEDKTVNKFIKFLDA